MDMTGGLTDAELGHLREAVSIAASAIASGELPYGSLLVDASGAVIAREHNTTLSSGDITAHPELKLARWAGLTLSPEERAACTMYTSCQPCTMCANVIARAGLGRVVYALGAEELRTLRPADLPRPDGFPVQYVGPALIEAAGAPITAYYSHR